VPEAGAPASGVYASMEAFLLFVFSAPAPREMSCSAAVVATKMWTRNA
jgi:hypothetical protein